MKPFQSNVQLVAHPVGLTTDSQHTHPVADHLLKRDESCIGSHDQMGDRYHRIWAAEGWLSVAVVLDLFARRIGMTLEWNRRGS